MKLPYAETIGRILDVLSAVDMNIIAEIEYLGGHICWPPGALFLGPLSLYEPWGPWHSCVKYHAFPKKEILLYYIVYV